MGESIGTAPLHLACHALPSNSQIRHSRRSGARWERLRNKPARMPRPDSISTFVEQASSLPLG